MGTPTLRFEKLESRKTLVQGLSEVEIGGGPLAKFGEPFLARYVDHTMELTLETANVRIKVGILMGTTRRGR